MKNIVLMSIILFTFSTCKKKEFDIKNLNGNKVGILGHGGMGIGHTYPMNSLESILNCLNLGADGTELDVQMTKDGVLVAFHDKTLDKTTNLNGHIYNKTWSEVKEARYKFPINGGYKIISLDDIFKNISHPEDYIFFFDCKNFQPNKDSIYLKTFNTALIKIIDQYNLSQSSYVENKSEKLIQSLQSIRPDIKQFIYMNYDNALSLAEKYSISGISIDIEKLTHEKVNLAHSKGIFISTFNAHSHKRNVKAVKHNVDFILTDKLKDLMKILED